MNDTPTISVIVPMYNAEKYLKTCITSILNQTFTDFELILVDNCSTDTTLEIAKSFSDSRIRILQTEKNTGSPGGSRNLGLDAARGEFIYFIDSDDAIVIQTLEMLHAKIVETNADIVHGCTWLLPNDPEFTELSKDMSVNTMSTLSDPVSKYLSIRILNELCRDHMHSVVWLCLYRRKIFDDGEKIRFPSNYLAEDFFVHFDLLCKTNKIVKIDTPFYIYRTNQNSVTKSRKHISKALESFFALFVHVEKRLSKLGEDENFIIQVNLSLLNCVSLFYFLPAYVDNSLQTFYELQKACKKISGEQGEKLAFMFYAYLWGQNESIKRTNFRTELQNLMDKNP